MHQARQWFTSVAGKVAGPYSEGFVALGLRTGLFAPGTLACEQGQREWRALEDWPWFAKSCPAPVMSVKAPWNPRWILALGLLFTPLWVGILAAMNARRLGMPTARWRPVALGGVAFVVWGFLLPELWWREVLVYAAGLTILWFTDLRFQAAAWDARPISSAAGEWLSPLFFGSPLAMTAVLTLLILPLFPDSPQQVCEKFAQATTSEMAQSYATQNLWPALSQMRTERGQGNAALEILAQEHAPAELGGLLVAARFYWPGRKEPSLLESIFHLVPVEGDWKVEEIYVTSMNHTPSDPPFRLSQSYRNLTPDTSVPVEAVPVEEPVEVRQPVSPADAPDPRHSGQSSAKSPKTNARDVTGGRLLGYGVAKLLGQVDWKRFSLLLAAMIIGGVGAALKALSRLFSNGGRSELPRSPVSERRG